MHLELQIIELLEAGRKIKLKWDCGGDQAIITIIIDNKELPYNSPILNGLDIYISNYLNLPSVGDIELIGEGEIIDENDSLYLVCESKMSYYIEDYEWPEDDEEDPEDCKTAPEIDEDYSGKRELFPSEKF